VEQLCNRKVGSVEDLFETQRKELFGRMSELEKVLSNKYINIARAVLDVAREVKMDETKLIL